MEQSFRTIGDHVTHARASSIIGHRRHHTAGLVHRDDHESRSRRHALAVHVDHRGGRIHARTQLGHHHVVDLHATFDDHRLGGPPTRNARLRQDFLKADSF